MTADLARMPVNTLASMPQSMPVDIPGTVEQLAAAAFEAGHDRAARTLFAVAELLRADATLTAR